QLSLEHYHRVIIPIYIPNLTEDYFKDGLTIFKLCIQSLLQTIHSKTRISLIDNGCCQEVQDYLTTLYKENDAIDQLLNSKINLGKVNAIYSAVKSNLEPLITISDADVMFLPKWQQEVEQIMKDFPECGMVSPVPSSKGYRSEFVNSTVYYGVFKGKIAFKDVLDPDGLIKFQESIGREMYDKIHLEKYLTLSNKRNTAVIGCGHFVATMRAEVFYSSPPEVCQHKIVGGSESTYFDEPNDVGGFLRLATMNNLAYHLGNVFEPWMKEKMDHIAKTPKPEHTLETLPKAKSVGIFGYKLGKLLRKLLFKTFKKQYFSIKGIKTAY
ncbi:MAG: glycosyltransferase family A protein, partial [Bacteroidota bacterium]